MLGFDFPKPILKYFIYFYIKIPKVDTWKRYWLLDEGLQMSKNVIENGYRHSRELELKYGLYPCIDI